MGRLLEYDCVLPRGEELEVGAVGFCGKRREITARDERQWRARARARACAASCSLLQPICMHAAAPYRHYSYLYPCVEH